MTKYGGSMEREEAIKIFIKYGFKYFSRWGSTEVLDYAHEYKYWRDYVKTEENRYNRYRKHDWVDEKFLEATRFILDFAGLNGRYCEKHHEIEKEVKDGIQIKSDKQYETQEKSRKKRRDKLRDQGQKFKSEMSMGDVYLVQFGRSSWPTRGLLVMEVEDSLSGFYLDRNDKLVPADKIEKKGYIYTKPNRWNNIRNKDKTYTPAKYEWDGKSFYKTRTYVTKSFDTVRGKVKDPKITKK